MKHVTERYGAPTSILVCTPEEFISLGDFLRPLGVELRTSVWSSEEVEAQARNPHRDWCVTSGHLTGAEIKNRADADIASGIWRR